MSSNQKENNLHANCFACASNNSEGLRLNFRKKGEDSVVGYFIADSKFEGYSGIVHGGIIATLLDSAMTHCLLKKGAFALTGRFSIRYFCPIRVGTVVELEARMIKRSHKIFFLEGKASVEGEKAAYAEARYVVPERKANQLHRI